MKNGNDWLAIQDLRRSTVTFDDMRHAGYSVNRYRRDTALRMNMLAAGFSVGEIDQLAGLLSRAETSPNRRNIYYRPTARRSNKPLFGFRPIARKSHRSGKAQFEKHSLIWTSSEGFTSKFQSVIERRS